MNNLFAAAQVVLVVAIAGCGRLGFDDASLTGPGAGLDAGGPELASTLSLVRGGGSAQPCIATVENDKHFDIAALGALDGFAVIAEVPGSPADVRFVINGALHDEHYAPFLSNGGGNSSVTDDPHLRVGLNQIVVQGFDAAGQLLGTRSVAFYLDAPVPGPSSITKVELVDNASGNAIVTVAANAQIKLATLAAAPSGQLDIRMTTSPQVVGSVATVVTGAVTNTFVDDWPVYSAFGPDAGFVPVLGTYTVTTTPYALGAAGGAAGASTTLTFEVIP